LTSSNQNRPIIGPDHQLPAPPKRHTVAKVILSLLVLLAFILVFIFAMRKHDETQKSEAATRPGGEAVTVTLATAKTGNIGLYLDEIGTVTPVYTDSITSQVSGVVTEVHFEEGQLVKKGDPLIDIDSRPYRATLLQAQGALERDENLLAQAQMDLERYRVAWGRNAIPKQTLDDQEKIVLQDEGTVKNDQGAVEYDQIQVDFCHITSPIAGRVGLRLVDPGNVVQSSGGVILAVITQISPITIIFTIAEDSIDLVESHLGDGGKLTVDAFDRAGQKKIASGVLLTLDNQIDTTTGTVKARSLFANPKATLFPNQFVNVRLLVTTLKGVTLIPSSAIQHNGEASFVYVIQEKTAHIRSVTAGVTDGGFTQVKGINSGDVAANSGFEKLQDNSKVAVATGPTTAASTRNAESTDSEAP
jgi:multidrug efflux system membrane fusion protein